MTTDRAHALLTYLATCVVVPVCHEFVANGTCVLICIHDRAIPCHHKELLKNDRFLSSHLLTPFSIGNSTHTQQKVDTAVPATHNKRGREVWVGLARGCLFKNEFFRGYVLGQALLWGGVGVDENINVGRGGGEPLFQTPSLGL